MYSTGQPSYMPLYEWIKSTKLVMDDICEIGRKIRKPVTGFCVPN